MTGPLYTPITSPRSVEPADEDRVIALILDRLELGHRTYGDLDVHDGRDHVQEALEEALDGAIYLACALLRLRDERGGSDV